MSKQKIISLVASLLIVLFIIMSLVNQLNNKSIHQTYFYLGTIIDITLYGTNDSEDLKEVSELIHHYDLLLDRNKETSDIYKLNRDKSSTVDPATYEILEKALSYGKISEGYFDISINPIVILWGIGTATEQVPLEDEIDAVLDYVDYQKVYLEDEYHVRLDPNTTIDLGGIAKGFIADEIVRTLKDKGIKRGLINLGGNVFALGNSPDKLPWNIGIRHPETDHNGVLLSIGLENKSVVTSGITERYFEENGQLYHHIFNPFTGYPIENDILSLTVITNKSIDGDALSTSLFALGSDKAFELLSTLDDVQLIIVTKNKEILVSSSLKAVTILDDTYKLVRK